LLLVNNKTINLAFRKIICHSFYSGIVSVLQTVNFAIIVIVAHVTIVLNMKLIVVGQSR